VPWTRRSFEIPARNKHRRWAQGGGQISTDKIMRHIILLTIFATPFLLSGQTRIITGKVIDEYNLEIIPEVRIQNHDTIRLGATDINGKFKIELPSGTDQLLLSWIGMEWTSLTVPADCDNLEIILMYDVIYDYVTIGTVNRKRNRRFKDLPNKHHQAHGKGIFMTDKPCFTYIFNKYK